MSTKHFALTAAAFEGSLVAVAMVLGWLLGQTPLETFHYDAMDVAWGLAATVPLLGLFWMCLVVPFRPFQTISRIFDESLFPLFQDCGVVQLLIIAALAGIGEEMLFRGVIQASIAEAIGGTLGELSALIFAAVLFGLLHLITPTYAALAGIIGLFLGWLWLATGNLLTPIITHGVYDFAALLYLVKIRGRKNTIE